ncbi:tryptophan--tRNA ligase [Candidatus Pelagibacter giovannonii]|uniref:Tryptophan--tRNA ligase n=1 Tax=Candidatus Pelagibacter giovannonii TaxID=2563896 RepID=A0A6H1Q2H1_9PROT|nr:tryptophan--tRNA ligase [Candidatus Pelagibacter giovannonii]QIZ21024.1 tryptophan--tRNA ligase [Candidatus Pelagibacter giovannonii]
MSKKIFSGVQPTGNLHLGNYLGAIKNFVELQNEKENECIFCVVDLHAITVKQDPKKLKKNIRETVATFIACGIDPAQSIIFNQSMVSAHSEAAWILSCVSRMGWLNRMTQFKEKAGKDKEKASIGLYSYPVLMAADILLYDATHVPVGNDQKQHLELCRDIAQKFNNDFDVMDFLKVPEPLIQKQFSRIMSLKDGIKKMSKSDPSDLSRINLTDDKDQIINKIKKAKTDPLPLPSVIDNLTERPEAENLLGIYSSLKNQNLEKSLMELNGKNFSEFKEQLSEILIERIMPISQEIKKLLEDINFLDSVLLEGSDKADKIASKKMKKMKELVGF